MPERRIYTRLMASTGVTSLLGTTDGIRPIKIPQGYTLPQITYQRISTTPTNHSTGTTTSQQCRIQVDCWAAAYGSVKGLAAQVEGALSGWQSSTATPAVDMTHLVSVQDLPEAPEPGQDTMIHRVSQDYLVDYVTT